KKWSMTSNSSAPRPSIRVTRPSSTTSSGPGSFGPSNATSPSSGHGEMSSSLRSSRATKRSDLRGTSLMDGQKPALRVDRERLPDERGHARSRKLAFEPLSPRFQLGGGGAARAQRCVDLEHRVGGNGGELGRPQQVLGERHPPRREGHRSLSLDRLRVRADVV